jgi:uncharacterized membrane protein
MEVGTVGDADAEGGDCPKKPETALQLRCGQGGQAKEAGKESRLEIVMTLLLAFGIGIVAGLRSLTAPAVVAWAAHLGWINIGSSPLRFMGSVWAVVIFTLLALVEFVNDQRPTTPARTAAMPLIARIVMGLLTGACLGIAGDIPPWAGALAGAVGATVGAFGGYQARVRLVRALRVADIKIAIPEDLVAVGLGLLLVSRF